MTGGLLRDNPFWRFSLRVYAKTEVREECLALQDTRGVDVNLLLFAAWLAAKRSLRMNEDDVADMQRLLGPWQATVVLPLRSARRAIKKMELLSCEEIRDLRERTAVIELDSEQIEQALLFEWSTRRWPTDGVADASLIYGNIVTYLSRFPIPSSLDAEPGAPALEYAASDEVGRLSQSILRASTTP